MGKGEMIVKLCDFIGESTEYDKKEALEKKLNELQFKEITKAKIRALYQRFGSELTFSRTDIMEVTGISLSPAGDLIRKMKEADLIEKYTVMRGALLV